MTNKKITDLAALASATSDDVLVIVDTATNTTKKITKGDFVSDVTSPPAGSNGQIQFNSSSAFGADSNLFWDNTNKRLGVGTSSPSASIQCTTFTSTSITDNGTTINLSPSYNVFTTRNVAIGAGDLPARLGVKGSGSTSATTSLLVQNSSGTELLKVTDDSVTQITNKLNIVRTGVTSQLIEINPNLQTVCALIRGGGNDKDFVLSSTGAKDLYLSTNFNNLLTEVQFALKHNKGVLIKDDASTAINDSAKLEITSTTKGFLPPRMTTTQKNAISSPASGLMVYDTDTNKLCCYNGSTWNDLF